MVGGSDPRASMESLEGVAASLHRASRGRRGGRRGGGGGVVTVARKRRPTEELAKDGATGCSH